MSAASAATDRGAVGLGAAGAGAARRLGVGFLVTRFRVAVAFFLVVWEVELSGAIAKIARKRAAMTLGVLRDIDFNLDYGSYMVNTPDNAKFTPAR